jgi:hypothetical protein
MEHNEIEISVGDVNDVEARVFVRYCGARAADSAENGRIVLRGTLRGPYCEGTRTLPAEFNFRDLGSGLDVVAEAIIPDPCTWSPDLPHLYLANVEARRDELILAKFHGMIGLRKGQHE